MTHSVSTMVARLRETPDAYGLCTANGGNLTKHAAGVYAAFRPAGRPRFARPQGEVGGTPSRAVAPGWTGPATLEAWTVMHDRDGAPEAVFAYGRTGAGAGAVGASRAPDVCAALAGGGATVEGAGLVWVEPGRFTLAW